MKLNRRDLRKLIIETIDGSGPLGNYVFPKDTKSGSSEEALAEPNTPLEDELSKSLAGQFIMNKQLTNNTVKKIISIIESGAYPQLFKRKTEGYVYRGISVDLNTFKNMYGVEIPGKANVMSNFTDWLSGETRINGKDTYVFSTTTHPDYKPNDDEGTGSFTSSWSKKKLVARNFSKDNRFESVLQFIPGLNRPLSDRVSILLRADAADSSNYFIDLTPFDKFTFSPFGYEHEVAGIGDIKVESSYVVHPNLLDVADPFRNPIDKTRAQLGLQV